MKRRLQCSVIGVRQGKARVMMNLLPGRSSLPEKAIPLFDVDRKDGGYPDKRVWSGLAQGWEAYPEHRVPTYLDLSDFKLIERYLLEAVERTDGRRLGVIAFSDYVALVRELMPRNKWALTRMRSFIATDLAKYSWFVALHEERGTGNDGE